MSEYQQRKRNAVRQGGDVGMGNPIPTSVPHTSEQVSANAGNSINAIDNLLDEESNAVTPATSPAAESGTEPEKGFFNREADPIDASGLKNLEASPATNKDDGNLFNPAEAPGGRFLKFANIFRMNRRRAVSVGAIGVVGGSAILFLSAIGSGPLELVHYSQILQRPFQHQEQAANSRLGSIMAHLNPNDAGETRLNVLQRKWNTDIQSEFAKEGIKINTDERTGQVLSFDIDASQSSKYKGLSASEAKAAIASDNNIELGRVQQYSGLNGGKFRVKISDLDLSAKRGIIGGFVNDQRLGAISTYNRFRILVKYYNLSLTPWKRAAAAADQKQSDAAKTKAAQQEEEDRLKAIAEKPDDVKALNADIADKLKPGSLKTVDGALVASAAVCTAKEVVDKVPEVNRANVIVPALKSTSDALAIGSGVMLNKPLNIEEVGAVVKNFTDSKGTTPWQSEGIQRLSGNRKATNNPAPKGILQAFTGDVNQPAIAKVLNSGSVSALCSPVSQIAQGVGGAALLFTGAGGVVLKGVQLGLSFGVGIAVQELASYLTQVIAQDAITGVAHQGITGGNVDALGAVGLSDSNAVVQGGVRLSNDETTQLTDAQNQNEAEQFRSESLATRIFDTHDYRSLSGHIIDTQNPDAMQNVASTFGDALTMFTHISSTLSSISSSLFSERVSAAGPDDGMYNLGVAEYGFSQSDLSNPLYSDPLANADAVAPLLDDGQYIDKAKTCFGVNISKDSEGKWDVAGSGDVNTASDDYTSANCGDHSDTNWMRVRFFVLDTSVMEGFACFQFNDDQSCTNDGFGTAATTDTTAGTGTPIIATGTAAELAQKLLDDPNYAPLSYSAVKQDLQDTAAGKTINNADTCGKTVSINADLLQVMLTATQKYKIEPINIITGHGCDQFLHPKGRATDIDFVTDLATGKRTNFSSGSAGDDPQLDHDFYVYIASILPKGGELGQDECAGRTGIAAPPGITFFEDTCTHQHVDLGNP